ncbi:hypothetical protein PTTG_29880 [Puccinia triticina 1-1 BBBD Race 1]|uniref:Uncharacterized protein n=1 Tax=Puccinia triticina (isolate 1-1 / race 1 (BBBD)) TaxID=630390 RepID=A0A180G1K5_PUCT1|nr:hypothetical protein PTTG_29880 [Puccinia triticina 1-1 BBBD Race 1]
MSNLIAAATATVKQIAGINKDQTESQGQDGEAEPGPTQVVSANQRSQQEEVELDEQDQSKTQAPPTKKTKKVTIQKASTRKIWTRSTSRAPEGDEGEVGDSEEGREKGGTNGLEEIWEVVERGGKAGTKTIELKNDNPVGAMEAVLVAFKRGWRRMKKGRQARQKSSIKSEPASAGRPQMDQNVRPQLPPRPAPTLRKTTKPADPPTLTNLIQRRTVTRHQPPSW